VVRMGAPRLVPAEVPFLAEGSDPAIEVPLEGFLVTAVSMGNPHAVILDGFEPPPLEAARRYGPALEVHPRFPKKTNVEFARVRSPRQIELAVWERGCGLTLACGTGASATAVAAVLSRRSPAGEEIEVRVPGGPLFIRVQPDLSEVFMRGAATEVFRGEVDLSSVATAPVQL
jgi:diaminopimelate epimerase